MTHSLTPAGTGIDAISKDVNVPVKTVTMFRDLLARLPDLTIYQPDPAKPNYYPCSRTANRMAEDCCIYDFKRPDEDFTDIYAWPYTTIDSFRVYSDPPYIIVGRVNTAGFGVVPTDKWEDKLDLIEMNIKAIRKIRSHLRGRPAIFYT